MGSAKTMEQTTQRMMEEIRALLFGTLPDPELMDLSHWSEDAFRVTGDNDVQVDVSWFPARTNMDSIRVEVKYWDKNWEMEWLDFTNHSRDWGEWLGEGSFIQALRTANQVACAL